MSGETQSSGDDLYETLGVPSAASDDEITRSYRRLARERHPDANSDAAGGAFIGLTYAYDVLRDPARRRASSPPSDTLFAQVSRPPILENGATCSRALFDTDARSSSSMDVSSHAPHLFAGQSSLFDDEDGDEIDLRPSATQDCFGVDDARFEPVFEISRPVDVREEIQDVGEEFFV